MSGFDYKVTASTVKRLIARFGGSVTWRKATLGAYNPDTSSAALTFADMTINGAVFDFGAGQTFQRGNLIQGGDKRLLLDSVQVPNMNDRFIALGTEYEIVSIGEVNPAGTSVMFDIHLRT